VDRPSARQLQPSRKRSISAEGRGMLDGTRREMGERTAMVVYVVAMVAVIVGIDVAFFRSHIWERLMANIGVVLVFAAFYLRFLRHP
jgi:hypothetical protein